MKKAILILCSVVLIGCGDDNDFVSAQEQLAIDIVKIDQYLEENNITALPIYDYPLENFEGDTGVRYVIDVEGSGVNPTINSTVVMKYEGRLLSNGNVFDTSETKDDKQIEFPLNGFIPGWIIGIPLFKEGDSGTLYIPSGWAYGKPGRGSDIGANAILIFDIELLEVK